MRCLVNCLNFLCILFFAGALSAGGDIKVSGKFVSVLPTGSPPLQVSSQTQVNNLNAEFLGGLSIDEIRLSHIVTVGKDGTGDFDKIQDAIDSITTAHSNNKYLIVIGPGVYQEKVVMTDNVYLRGSGTNLTVITSTGGNTIDNTAATLTLGASGLEGFPVVSDLQVESNTQDTGNAVSMAVFSDVPSTSKLDRVYVTARKSGLVSIGIYNSGTSLYVSDSEVQALYDGALATHAIWNVEGRLKLNRTFVYAFGGTLKNNAIHHVPPAVPSGTIRSYIRYSEIYGDITSETPATMITTVSWSAISFSSSLDGDVTCLGVTSADTFHPDTCP